MESRNQRRLYVVIKPFRPIGWTRLMEKDEEFFAYVPLGNPVRIEIDTTFEGEVPLHIFEGSTRLKNT